MRGEGGQGLQVRQKATLATMAIRKDGSVLSISRVLRRGEGSPVCGRLPVARRRRLSCALEEN